MTHLLPRNLVLLNSLVLLLACLVLLAVRCDAGPFLGSRKLHEQPLETRLEAAAAAAAMRRALQQVAAEAEPNTTKPSPETQARLNTFKLCMDMYVQQPIRQQLTSATGLALNTSSISSRMNVTYQEGTDAVSQERYAELHARNAQLRGLNHTPIAIAEPASTADVAAAVRCANTAGLAFAARNGGHSYEATSLLHGGVVIDLLALQQLQIDEEAGTVTVGAGHRLGPLYAALSEQGCVLPGGTCAGVGVSGLTLGGGIGHSTRALGLLADSVVGAGVVLANGSVVEASNVTHPDLLWAISGGGPLYGIVTSWTYKLHKAPEKVSVVRYMHSEGCTEASYASVLGAFVAWQPWRLPSNHAMVEIQCGYGNMHVQLWLWGSMSLANKTMVQSPVFELPGWEPLVQKELSWPEFVVYATNLHDDKDWSMKNLTLDAVLAKGLEDRSSFTAASLLPTRPLSAAAVATQARLMAEGQEHAFIQSRVLRGRAGPDTSRPDKNAFPWRDALYENQVYSSIGDAVKDAAWVEGVLAAMQPLVGTAEYYNYYHCVADPWASYFGPERAARLQQIKAAYDPVGRIGGLHCQGSASTA